jgi:hypothetical protein
LNQRRCWNSASSTFSCVGTVWQACSLCTFTLTCTYLQSSTHYFMTTLIQTMVSLGES